CDRLLHAQSLPPQRAADMGRVVAHAKRPVNHDRDALGRPDLTDEAVRLRPRRQQIGQPRPLRRGQLRYGSRRQMAAQRRHATSQPPLQPAAPPPPPPLHRRADRLPRPPLLIYPPGPPLPPLADVLPAADPSVAHGARSTTAASGSQISAAVRSGLLL